MTQKSKVSEILMQRQKNITEPGGGFLLVGNTSLNRVRKPRNTEDKMNPVKTENYCPAADC